MDMKGRYLAFTKMELMDLKEILDFVVPMRILCNTMPLHRPDQRLLLCHIAGIKLRAVKDQQS